MRWAWHSPKNDWTLQERGFDFAFAVRIFERRVRLSPTDRNGERRIHAIGVIDGRYYVVVYAKRHDEQGRVRRVISARRARDNEKAHYDARAR